MPERDLETIVREHDARWQIHDVIMRWARGIDRNDRELIRSAYHPDGWDDHGAFAGTPAEFADWVVVRPLRLTTPGQPGGGRKRGGRRSRYAVVPSWNSAVP